MTDLLVSDRIGQLNRSLLAFRVGLYAVIIVGLATSGRDASLAIALVTLLTFVPALPLNRIRPNRVEVGVATSLLVEFALWFWFGDVAGLTVLPLLSIAVAGLFSTRTIGIGVGMVAIALQAIQTVAHAAEWTSHTGITNPPTTGNLVSESVLLLVVIVAFVGLGDLLRDYQRDLAARIEEKARLDRVIAEKDHLIDSMAHELRTPLTAVIGFSDLIWQDSDDLDRADLTTIARSVAVEGNHLRRVIDNFVVGARAENAGITLELGPVDVRSLLEEAWKSMSIDTGWTLTVEGESTALADERRLRHIFDNLLDNAIRHGEDPVSIAIAYSDDVVIIDFVDGGPGPQRPERLFDRYEADRDDNRPGNIGLGLPTSRIMAQSMGGTVSWADDRFRVSLPTVSSLAPDSAGPAVAPHPTA